MSSELMYELRVLNGEQRGASSTVKPGVTLRIGRDWSNDVVLRGAQESFATLSLDDQGQLRLDVKGGHCQLGDMDLAAGEQAGLSLYTPFEVGKTRMAVGRIGASQWASLFDEPVSEDRAAPIEQAAVAGDAPSEKSLISTVMTLVLHPSWIKRLMIGGGVLVGISVGALTLAWAMGPSSLSSTQKVQNLRQTLAHLGFSTLHVENKDGQLIVTGHLETQAQRSKLEQALSDQTPARLAVWVNDQVTAAVGDVYRLNGISAEVRSGGSGVVHVQTREADIDKLKKVQAAARRDVPGLQQLVSVNSPPPAQPQGEAVPNDPGKRVAAIVPGDSAYVVTADGTRYFEGALLPTGHRILAILSDRVQIERDGVASSLNF